MKQILLLFMIAMLSNFAIGQSSFENDDNCDLDISGDYADIDCSDTWFSTHGSPNIVRETSPIYGTPKIKAPEGDFFASMSYLAVNDAVNCKSEGVFKEIGSLNSGSKFLLSFQHRLAGSNSSSGDPTPIQVAYTSGLNHNPSNGQVTCLDFGSDAILDLNSFSNNFWTDQSILFFGEAGKDQIAFAPSPNVINNGGYYLVDNFKLVACNALAPNYKFTDEEGNYVDSYCYGEDVFIIIDDVDYEYDEIYISAEASPEYLTPGWQNDLMAGGPHNISQIFRDHGVAPFTPGQIYDFKLALQHPECGWVERIKPFEYVCCEIESGFDIEESGLPAPYNVEANALFDYTPYGGIHEFCLFTDENNDGIFEEVECATSPSLFVTNLQEGVRFYMSHVLTTACGDYCEVIDFCAGSNCDGPVSANLCDVLVPPTCLNTKPIGLTCPQPLPSPWQSISRYDITWNPIPGVGVWEVEVDQYDTECGCIVPSDGSGITYNDYNFVTDGTFARVKATPCFSYRVRGLCPNGEWGPWSDKVCYPDCGEGGEPRNEIETSESILSVYPNPFQDEVKINLENANAEKVDVLIYNQVGQLVENFSIVDHTRNVNATWRPSAELSSGLYIIRVSNGSRVINKKVLYNK